MMHIKHWPSNWVFTETVEEAHKTLAKRRFHKIPIFSSEVKVRQGELHYEKACFYRIWMEENFHYQELRSAIQNGFLETVNDYRRNNILSEYLTLLKKNYQEEIPAFLNFLQEKYPETEWAKKLF